MACTDYNGEFWRALGEYAFRDAVLCPYQETMTGVVFASFVILGMINLPIYIRQESILVPFIITLVVGGIIIAETAAMVQGIVVVVLLFTIGIGPILLLRRIQ